MTGLDLVNHSLGQKALQGDWRFTKGVSIWGSPGIGNAFYCC